MTGALRRPASKLHALTLSRSITAEQLGAAIAEMDAMSDRHRLAEAAVYASACRRWLMLTGRVWVRAGSSSTSWGADSAHRVRIDSTTWRCSCGARGDATDPHAAHAQHAEAARCDLD